MGKFKEGFRKTAEKISKGVIENQHLGSHSSKTIDQELYSLENTKPMFRDSKWHKSCKTLRENISKEIARGKRNFQQALTQLNRIENQR